MVYQLVQQLEDRNLWELIHLPMCPKGCICVGDCCALLISCTLGKSQTCYASYAQKSCHMKVMFGIAEHGDLRWYVSLLFSTIDSGVRVMCLDGSQKDWSAEWQTHTEACMKKDTHIACVLQTKGMHGLDIRKSYHWQDLWFLLLAIPPFADLQQTVGIV